MEQFQILSRRERYAIPFAACVTGLGVMSGALLAFVDDGNTPWFDASSDLAIAAQRCDVTPNSSRRHECLREVAQAAARPAPSPTRLARQ